MKLRNKRKIQHLISLINLTVSEKNNMKKNKKNRKETVEEYLRRGGKITYVPMKLQDQRRFK